MPRHVELAQAAAVGTAAAVAGDACMTLPMDSTTAALDYAAFLQQQLATQPHNVMAHVLGHEQIWIKRAGAPHGNEPLPRHGRAGRPAEAWTRCAPCPTPGGPTAIATEVQRLRIWPHAASACPWCWPPPPMASPCATWATRAGETVHSLGNEIDHAVQAGDTASVLALWQQGLDTLTQVHRQGTCLSQAFARNLVRCPDGEVASHRLFDDPAAVLPLAVCHVRDALCYAHSTAIYLHTSGTLTEGRARWSAWVAQGNSEMRAVLATSVRRMGWMRHLPTNRKLGADLQRVRAAYDLLA